MTTLLVTGGAGFIGNCFIRHELKKHPDYKIINLDALTYCGNIENLKDIENNPNYKFVHGNICDRELVAGLIGLIPNCAASVVITQLYLEGALSFGAMMSGLLVGAGIGIAVLLRMNKDIKKNFQIIAILYGYGVIFGIIIELLGR